MSDPLNLIGDPEMEALIERALRQTREMTPEQREEMYRLQRESWARGEMSWPKPRYKWVNGTKVYESYADYCAD